MGCILIVGGSGDREVLAGLLELDGHQVLEAGDSEVARQLIVESGPEVLLVDISTPQIDGFEILRQVRLLPAGRRLPVVVLGTTGSSADRARAAKLAALDYIEKPWMPGEVKLRVSWALKRSGTVPAVPWQQSDSDLEAPGPSAVAGGEAGGPGQPDVAPAKNRPAPLYSRSGIQEVTPEKGGNAATDDGVLRVDVPPGAVRSEMGIDAASIPESDPPRPSALRVRMGRTVGEVSFTDQQGTPVEGVKLSKPARISIGYDELDAAEAGSDADLAILKYDLHDATWAEMASAVDPEEGRVTAWEQDFSCGRRGNGGKVLVAVDREEAGHGLAETVEGAGFEVFREWDGGSAARRVMEERPEVVLLSVSLSRLNGFQVLRQIKGEPATRGTSVIMFSESDQHGEFATALTLGARDVVMSPWYAGDVQRRVKRAFDATRARMKQEERAVERARARLGSGP